MFADTGNNRIRKVDSTGKIVTIAGNGAAGFTNDGVSAVSTSLNQPLSIAYVNGEIYIADTTNHRVRKIFANGPITNVAGNGTAGFCDDDLAINACVNRPVSVVVNNDGEVFISDQDNHVVRKVDKDGIISMFAGIFGSGYDSGDGGLATNAQLNRPQGLTINREGELLIADTNNNVIRKVDKNGIISTVANGVSSPVDVSVGQDGELFIVESGGKHQITKIDNNGLKITVAGTYGGGGPSISDFRPADNVPLAFVSSVSVLSDTELIVTDTYNHMIKRVNITAKSITPLTLGSTLSYPRGTNIVNGEIYFADYGNHCIRKIDSNGVMSDVVGVCGSGGYSGDGAEANNAQLFYPSSVAVAPNGDMFIADSGNHIIRRVSVVGIITTIAGIPGETKFSGNDAPALNTHLYEPTDLAIAPNGDLYLSDHENHCIRRIDLNSGIIKGVAGNCGKIGFSGDGGLAISSRLSHPRGLAFTKAGELLIADFGNSVIRKVNTETGIIVTIAGVGESVGYRGDGGSPINAQLNRPTGVAVSASDDYFIVDFGNHLIRVVEPTHTCGGISNKNSTACSGKGFCIASDTCRCQSGYYGEDCSITTCFGTWSNETAVCSSNGKCTAFDTCVCGNGYAGYDCPLSHQLVVHFRFLLQVEENC